MEKLAVDLEKLLDDFEFHEEQRIDIISKQPGRNDNYSIRNYRDYPQYCPPASSYEHSTYGSIALSDADFCVTPPPPSIRSQSQYLPPLNSDTNAFTSLINDTHTIASREASLVHAFKNGEFKPDLIKSNSDMCSSLTEFDWFERHLPDIASNNEIKVAEKINFNSITDSIVSNVDCQGVQEITVVNEIEESSEFTNNRTHISCIKLGHYSKEVEKHDSDKGYESSKSSANKISIQAPFKIEVNECNGKNEITIDDKDDEVVSNKAAYPIGKPEQSPLELNTHTESMTIVAVVNKSDSEYHKTESSIIEVTSNTEGSSTAGDWTVGGVNFEESLTEPLLDVADGNSSPQSVVNVESGYEANDNEAPNTINDVVKQLKLISEALPLYKYIVEGEKDGINDLESLSIDENVRCEKQTVKNENNDGQRVINNEVSINLLSTASITQKESPLTVKMNRQFRDTKIKAESTFLNSSCDMERPSTSKCADKYDSLNEINTTNSTQFKIQRPDSLNLTQMTQNAEMSSPSADSGSLLSIEERRLGKEPPVWIPDSESSVCMHCQTKFTLVRRRHHCRACGFVLCSKCCDLKANLEYLRFEEARVCHSCHSVIERINCSETSSMKKPNPNNPMEYCSTIPPLLQVGPTQSAPPSVLVPVVGVLKREGRSKVNDTPKQVIFSDGIRPGGDLTELDSSSEPRLSLSKKYGRFTKRVGSPPGEVQQRRMLNPETHSFIPLNQDLPPLVAKRQGEFIYSEVEKPLTVKSESVKFAINRNLFVLVKKIILDCCVNRNVWCMTTEGLSFVGQDEVVFILEVLPDEEYPPKDVFWIVNMLYQEASKGSTMTEMSFASAYINQLFNSKEHAGFVFIRPTYQCVRKLLLPEPPFLIALLIHKWEAPWARLFPIRLVLRLGAEFRYYPCPLVSVRNRPALFTDIGNTIIGLLADFRKFSYSLPTVRGLTIHMEDRLTTILLPRNRYDQVIRAMNDSEENVLAFMGNISIVADSHLVCIQSVQNDLSYHTQAINIHNKPRQVTGASFIVFNGSLKQCSWAGKSNIVEDGLMVQIPSDSMTSLRSALRQMNDYSIGCGPQAEERVMLKWAPDDVNFNIGVKSHIDSRPLDGVPSIRVHNGTDYSGTSSRLIRWTEVFILQSDEDSGSKTGDTVNISKLSESIARASCIALVPLLDLLATANLTTLAVRAKIHPENVGYEAGSCGEKLRPLYMKRLDNELITVVHEAAVSICDISCPIVLELIFKIMEQ